MSIGTKKVGYAGPQYGPFHCSNCEYFFKGGCDNPQVLKDPGVPSKGDVKKVDEDGCCNEFEPKKVNVAKVHSRA